MWIWNNSRQQARLTTSRKIGYASVIIAISYCYVQVAKILSPPGKIKLQQAINT